MHEYVGIPTGTLIGEEKVNIGVEITMKNIFGQARKPSLLESECQEELENEKFNLNPPSSPDEETKLLGQLKDSYKAEYEMLNKGLGDLQDDTHLFKLYESLPTREDFIAIVMKLMRSKDPTDTDLEGSIIEDALTRTTIREYLECMYDEEI